MLDAQESDFLSRVGPGTPGGDLLRRYWQPVAYAAEVTQEHPIKRVRILGEDLVLFARPSGEYGLVSERCPHRGASLGYGFVEPEGIRCAYHGWLFDADGACIERPFEPNPNPHSHAITAYPVEALAGVLFAYLGPRDEQPLLPRWDLLVRDGVRRLERQADLRCNWLQVQENAVDVTHTYFLHAYRFHRLGLPDTSGFGRPLSRYGFQPFEWGILKSWTYDGATPSSGWGNLLVFPNMLRLMTEMHWRVPVDDVTTRIFWVSFAPAGLTTEGASSLIEQPSRVDAQGEYLLDTFMSQDAMAVETQGAIADRQNEHLGASDIGITIFRRLLREQIINVQAGERPMALTFKAHEMIDLREWMGGDLPMSCADDPTPRPQRPQEAIFDERHEVVEVAKTAALRPLLPG